MGTKRMSYVKGRRLRATRLDRCGRPIYAEDSSVVSRGMISVGYTAVTSESDAVDVVNAAGETIASEPAVPSLNGYGVEIVFGEVDPDLFALMTGMPVVFDAFGNVVGLKVDTAISLDNSNFALEVWAGAPTTDACATDAAVEGSFGYILLPFVSGGILGDFTVENGAISFTVTGATTRRGGSWGRGPYDVVLNPGATPSDPKVPGPLLEPMSPTEPLLLQTVELAPPADVAGARPLMDPSTTALTSVTGTRVGTTKEYNFAVLPDPDAEEAIWFDFGDGEWDYVVGDDGNHTYAEAGTYTVTANNGGGKVTTTVTVV